MEVFLRNPGRSPFDVLRHEESDGTEWWSAREMMEALGYERWENMDNALDRAKAQCRNLGGDVQNHFREVTNMVNRPQGGGRPMRDVQMDRYGAYLLAMNGDPNKPQIAAAQGYFAIQTRRAEIGLPPLSQAANTPAVQRSWSERLSETVQWLRLDIQKRFPFGAFSTYTATSVEILMIEDELANHKIPVQYGDLPDGSIGHRWSRYRKEASLVEPLGKALLDMPHLERIVDVWVYGHDLRPIFDEWLNTIYIPKHMPDYFERKWGKGLQLASASAADRASLRLTGKHAILSEAVRSQLKDAGGIVLAESTANSQN